MRGNLIKYNHIYRVIGPGSVGTTCIYLDDMFSSAVVYGNVLVECYRGFLLGGGRNNIAMNNIFINNTISIHIDDRGLTWANPTQIMANLLAMPYNNSLWASYYPELSHILDSHPLQPVGNLVQFNLVTMNLQEDLKHIIPLFLTRVCNMTLFQSRWLWLCSSFLVF